MNTYGYKAIYAETLRQQHQIIADLLGLQITWIERFCKGGKAEGAFIGEKPWRPLHNDGDAFRLAIHLNQMGLNITLGGNTIIVGDLIQAQAGSRQLVRAALFDAALQLAKCSPGVPQAASASDSHE